MTAAQIAVLLRVQDRRRTIGLSIPDAAERGGISPDDWYAVEGGLRTPTMATLTGMARGLDMSLRDVMGMD